MQFIQPRKRLQESRLIKRPQHHRKALRFIRLHNLRRTHQSCLHGHRRQTYRLAASGTAVIHCADYRHGTELR